MTEQSNDHVRTLFTEIGCVMEDASVIALIWADTEPISSQDRHQRLLNAYYKVGTALEKIEATIKDT